MRTIVHSLCDYSNHLAFCGPKSRAFASLYGAIAPIGGVLTQIMPETGKLWQNWRFVPT
jgi:hypothetical protein